MCQPQRAVTHCFSFVVNLLYKPVLITTAAVHWQAAATIFEANSSGVSQ